MEKLFRPQSILVIGVSASPNNMGRNIVNNSLKHGFQGKMHLMGRHGGELGGMRIHQDFTELPRDIEMAIILTPAPTVNGYLEECGRLGIRWAVIETGGFSELTGREGSADDELLETANRWGIRFVGPNGLGIICRHSGLTTPFMPFDVMPRPGNTSLLAQSGGVGVVYLQAMIQENMGVDRFVSMGNKLSLDESDYLDDAAEKGSTEMVCFYLEDIRRGRRFYQAISRFPGPVVIQKANVSRAGAKAAASHTSSFSVNDDLVEASIKQANGLRVQSMDEMICTAMALSLPRLRGDRILLVSRSGGHAVIAADYLEKWGFTLPELPDRIVEIVSSAGRANVIRAENPLDLGDVFDFDAYRAIIETGAASPDIDGLVFMHVFADPREVQAAGKILEEIKRITAESGKPVFVSYLTTASTLMEFKQKLAYPIFPGPEQMIEAMGRARRWVQREALARQPRPLLPQVLPELGDEPAGLLAPDKTFALLESLGIPCAGSRTATSLEELEQACADLTFPLVMKIDSPDLPHKSDLGGVVLGIGDVREARAAYTDMMARIRSRAPQAQIRGVLLQEQIQGEREVFVGAGRDPSFGPFVVCGRGGIWVEKLKDVSIRLAPIHRADAEEMLGEVSWFKTFDAFRGRPAGDRSYLMTVVEKISQLIAGTDRIIDIDINPLLLGDEGELGKVVDARITLG